MKQTFRVQIIADENFTIAELIGLLGVIHNVEFIEPMRPDYPETVLELTKKNTL